VRTIQPVVGGVWIVLVSAETAVIWRVSIPLALVEAFVVMPVGGLVIARLMSRRS
jgi:hypothetical protein